MDKQGVREVEMAVVGADGCRSGWFAVRRESGESSIFKVFGGIAELWREWSDASLILLDIPIGLPDAKHNGRLCDYEARRMIGPRRSSVFPSPSRASFQGPTYEAASAANYRETGKKLTKQTWAISPKIREVDRLLRENAEARSKIREVHPEVCFRAFAGRTLKKPKKRRPGFEERLKILTQIDAAVDTLIESALEKFRRAEVERDDILDATVAALTAGCGHGRLLSLPCGEPQQDAYGLPMEMVYCYQP